jgi:hypothetical protein
MFFATAQKASAHLPTHHFSARRGGNRMGVANKGKNNAWVNKG